MAGGRGKGTFSSGLKGGVKVTRNLDSVAELAHQMINYKLVTKQTPKDGVQVRKVNNTIISNVLYNKIMYCYT